MKKLFLSLLIFALTNVSYAQISDPVEWNFKVHPVNENIYEITITANIQDAWHIYSQYTERGGPFPTEIFFKNNTNVRIKGGIKEVGNLIEKYEEVFEIKTRYYQNQIKFIQVIERIKPVSTTLSGNITFMACSKEVCLAPTDLDFEIVLN